jgi:nucleoside-diphosphate-sugar epimerase
MISRRFGTRSVLSALALVLAAMVATPAQADTHKGKPASGEAASAKKPHGKHAAKAKTVVVPSGKYFGKYYQDIQKRVPAITNAKKLLGWTPKVNLEQAIKLTLDYHLTHKDYRLE